ncbi:MAG TPA: MFS transporter [Polyangia bacterium]
MSDAAISARKQERKLVFLLAAVQFVNILDFMMVMPLGPDFAEALGIPTSRLGIIGGSYTAAAAVAGLIGAQFLDRFDRRRALAVAMLGLVVATAGGALAQNFGQLVATRICAGAFGGPATSIALAILSDAVPPERRGRAMGAVMGSFSVASVLGVPAGLELAHRGDWRTPFFAVAGLGLLVVVGVFLVMPPQRAHLQAQAAQAPAGRNFRGLLADARIRLALAATVAAFLGVFAVIPNITAFFQYNLGYPREDLGSLYFFGGVVSFFAMRAAGRIVDRRGPMPAIWFGSLLISSLFAGGFLPERTPIPVPLIFVGFMLANSVRVVGLNTLTSKLPAPPERARYMSLQSAVQHIAAAIGAGLSSVLLYERQGHALGGMPRLAMVAIASAMCLPFLVLAILRRSVEPVAATTPTAAA